MPSALNPGNLLQNALPLLNQVGQEGDVSETAEQRARMVEAQAQRQAEAEARTAQDQADALREKGEKARARARVGAATSGLTLSGTSLLSLENLEAQNDGAVEELLGDSALRIDDILTGADEQARSIRLSGRVLKNWGGGSLLNPGGSGLGGSAPRTEPGTI